MKDGAWVWLTSLRRWALRSLVGRLPHLGMWVLPQKKLVREPGDKEREQGNKEKAAKSSVRQTKSKYFTHLYRLFGGRETNTLHGIFENKNFWITFIVSPWTYFGPIEFRSILLETFPNECLCSWEPWQPFLVKWKCQRRTEIEISVPVLLLRRSFVLRGSNSCLQFWPTS